MKAMKMTDSLATMAQEYNYKQFWDQVAISEQLKNKLVIASFYKRALFKIALSCVTQGSIII